MNIVSSKLFTYEKKTKTFVTEESSLGDKFQPTIDGDIAFYIESAVTGKKLRFNYQHSDVSDGEVTGWRYVSECGNFCALIIND